MFLHGADYNYEQWLDRPDVLDRDFEAMEAAGCTVMSVGIFSWAAYEPREGEYHFEWMDGLLDRLHSRGMKAILATPTAAKPAWLSKAYPSSRMVDSHGHRAPHGGRHNHCRTSKDYRRLAVGINTRLAQRYGGHPALHLWHVNNEYGSTRCYCGECLTAFRTWLRARYGDLETLNRAWWTDFWSHRFGDWDEIEPQDPSITGLMLDWSRFTSDQTIDFFLEESRPLRQLTPYIPVTTNFHGPDVGLDYFAFARHIDVASWDAYPRWHTEDDGAVAARTAFHHDLVRSTKGKPFLLMESTPSQTNWQGVSPLKRPGLHVLASLQAVAHGSDSVQYFQWRQSRGGEETFHGAVLANPGSMDTRTFRDVAEVGRVLKRLAPLAGTPVRTRIAVVLDFENHWALSLAQLPRNLSKSYWDEVLAHHAALGRRGYAADVVDSTADFSQYQVVVAPMLYLMRPGVVQSLEAFVQRGGTLVTGYLTGWVDESGLAFFEGKPGPLSRLLGLKVEETDALPEGRLQTIELGPPGRTRSVPARHYADLITVEGAEVMGTYGRDFYAGTPAVTRRKEGRGQAWYVGARTDSAFLIGFLEERCREAGLLPQVPWTVPPGVEVRSRGEPGAESVFVMNFNAQPVEIPVPENPFELEPFGWRLLTPS